MQELKNRFEIPGVARIEPGNGGLSKIVVTTPQQVSLAVGVATLGTLFVTLTGSIGALHAALVVLAVQAVVAGGIAVGSRGLPRAA